MGLPTSTALEWGCSHSPGDVVSMSRISVRAHFIPGWDKSLYGVQTQIFMESEEKCHRLPMPANQRPLHIHQLSAHLNLYFVGLCYFMNFHSTSGGLVNLFRLKNEVTCRTKRHKGIAGQANHRGRCHSARKATPLSTYSYCPSRCEQQEILFGRAQIK